MNFKKFVAILYLLVIVVMAFITVTEKYVGTVYASDNLYGSWWFSLLWILLSTVGVVYIVKQKLRKWNIVLLHLSFIVILAGALLTHVTSSKGTVHLKVGEINNALPFLIQLNDFKIQKYVGSDAACNYTSFITIIDGKDKVNGQVSMNHILTYKGVRLYQSTYDEDGEGCTLRFNCDPWGIPVTYVGYALLFFSLIYLLIDPKGTFRKLLKHPLMQKGFVAITFLFVVGNNSLSAQTTVFPAPVASHVCEMYMQYNSRICQIQTYAYEFTRKVSGKRSYKGCTPEQILTGFIFWGDQWANEKIIKVKGTELKEYFHLTDYVSVNELFNSNGYILKRLVEEFYQQDKNDALHEQAVRLDDKVNLIAELRMGKALNLIRRENVNDLYRYANMGQNQKLLEIVDENIRNQKKTINGIPSSVQVSAERINNRIPFSTILFMVNLTMGFLSLFILIRLLARIDHRIFGISYNNVCYIFKILLLVSFFFLSFLLVLRWIISENIPLSNGYESMLSAAWFVMLISIIFSYRLKDLPSYYMTQFGFLLSGFLLLVSHINQMDPAIGRIMPVLNSPLLSIHVSIIMMSYALLALTFVCGLLGLLMKSQAEMLQVLSRILLYPAITTMGLGIFIGAVWANISWGTYWSWDPKETWALITFMIYAVVLHTQSYPIFRDSKLYHLYMVFAFLSIIMTYFGVNYILGGMHSYA